MVKESLGKNLIRGLKGSMSPAKGIGLLIVILSVLTTWIIFAYAHGIDTPFCTTTSDYQVCANQDDYTPSSTVHIAGIGFAADTNYQVKVTRPDGSVVTGDGSFQPWPTAYDTVTTDANGGFQYDYILDGITGQYHIDVLDSDGNIIASHDFLDAPPKANLDQCRNGPVSSPVNCTSATWVNGNAGASNAHYVEGLSIPYRAVLTDLPPSTSITIVLGYDITHGGPHAIDYLTHYQRIPENVSPTDGIAGISGPNTTFAIPAPSSAGSPVTGQPTTSFNALPAGERLMTLFGGTITGVSYVTEGSLTNSTSETQISVTFTSGSSTEVLSWGGHIAAAAEWGAGNSAGGISGSPYHMRTISWTLNGIGNQDRSLSADAVIAPITLTVNKVCVPSNDAGKFNLRIDGANAGTGTDASCGGTTGAVTVTAASHTVSETAGTSTNLADYTSVISGDCAANGAVTLVAGDNKVCTITNTKKGTIIVEKQTDPDGAAGSFTFTGTASGTISDNGQIVVNSLVPGTYTSTETNPAPAFALTSIVCDDGSSATPSTVNLTNRTATFKLDAGETVKCTFTNTLQQAHLTLVKTVTKDNGGTAVATDWTLSASGPTPISGATGSGAVTNAAVNSGTYTLSESGGPSGYTGSTYSCVNNGGAPVVSNSITLAAGDIATCTINNNDAPAHLIIIKQVINDNGGTKAASDFSGTITGVTASGGQSWTGTLSPGVDKTLTSVGSYSVTENSDAGYDTTYSVNCSGTIALNQTNTCIVTNNDKAAHLIVIKHVINDNGGTKTAADFSMTIGGVTASGGNTFAGAESPGTNKTLTTVGAYSVTETGPSGYSATNSTDCSGTIALGQTKNCTITNNDIAPKLTVTKVVINDNGGTKVVANFPLTVDNASDPVTSGVQNTFNAGGHTANETGNAGYAASVWSGDCLANGSVSLAPGDVKACTITNNDKPAHVIVFKHVINDDGGNKTASFFNIDAINVNGSGDNNAKPTVFSGNESGTDVSLFAGSYTISEFNTDGYTVNYTVNCSGTIANGETRICTVTNDDIPAEIHGIKFKDDNGNGVKDGGEPTLSGWTIFLDTNDNGVLDGGEPSTATAANGSYSFIGLSVGTYHVREVLQNGWLQTLPTNPTKYDVTLTNGQVVNGKDFGNFEFGRVSGNKFNDLNGNGVKDNGEPALENWTIVLTYPNGTTISQLTDNNGHYIFRNLTAGNHIVSEILQDGWIQTKPTGDGSYHILIHSGSQFTQKDFGNFQLGNISGFKFNDLNGDGIWQQSEPALSDWTINLDNGSATTSTTTDVNGHYEFTGLHAGTYTVTETQQNGWIQTTSNPAPINVVSGTNSQYNNFGNFKEIIISGQKFNDLNGNGVKDGGEPGLEGWTINLGNGTTAVTDGSGNYQFTGIHPGTYSLTEVLQDGWIQTTPNPDPIAASSGTDVSGIDFGNFQLGKINGTKFNDINGNGAWDNGEPTLSGWTINLDNGTAVISSVTDVNGNYQFTGLHFGTYDLTETLQAGWAQTTPNPSSINVVSGTDSQNNNFGNFKYITINGTKFNDSNGNGVRDLGENGLAGWTINLGNGTTTVTDSNGNYQFTNVGPGTYSLTEVLQAGWVQTTSNPAPIITSSGTDVSGIDFGNFKNITITVHKNVFAPDNVTDISDSHSFTANNNAADPKTIAEGTDAVYGNLGPGTYIITEDADAGYDLVSITPPSVVAVSGTNADVYVVNKLKPIQPAIVTQASSSTITIGDSITDSVTITGQSPIQVTGNVTFFVCNGATCTSGGTNLGNVTLGANTGTVTATSAAYTPATNGTYTFRAEYSGDANYLPAIDTNSNTLETFTVTLPITRTQGFWQTHTTFTTNIFLSKFSVNNPLFIGQNVTEITGTTHRGRISNTQAAGQSQLFGAYYSNIPKKTTGVSRASVDQARMTLLQQLVTAKLNCAAFSCSSGIQTNINNADSSYAAGNIAQMLSYSSQLDAYNNLGDNQTIPISLGPVGSATPKTSQSVANKVFWDAP